MKKVVILTGAGISAESGTPTFRGSDGLWEGHDIMDVASPQGWEKDRELVLKFYNERRQQAKSVEPNPGHTALVDLEAKYDVTIITQNVDNLHEKAGSSKVVHLHGELFKSRSTLDESLVYDCKGDINLGDKCEKGAQLRPHIVWFGEMVPMIEIAAGIAAQADIFMVIGTSMVVYPAAGLINFVGHNVPKFVIDPSKPEVDYIPNVEYVVENGSTGVPKVVKRLLAEAG